MKVLKKLHGLGPRIVIITSTNFGEQSADKIYLYASQIGMNETEVQPSNVLKVAIPVLKSKETNDGAFTGTGDLLCAMLLTHNEKYPDDLKMTVEHAVNIVHQTLATSIETPLLGTREINIIASKKCIEEPKIEIKCQRLG